MSKNTVKKILSKEAIKKAANEGACLQRIQMIVWTYIEKPKHLRNGVEMASKIFEEVKKTLNNKNEKNKEKSRSKS